MEKSVENPLEKIQIPMVPVHHHRSIVSEHELVLDGIRFRERKEMVKFSNDSGESITELVHSRYIGNEKYLQVTQTLKNGEVKDEEIVSNLENDEAMEDFQKQWVNEWFPVLISVANMNLQRDLPKQS